MSKIIKIGQLFLNLWYEWMFFFETRCTSE